MLLNNSVGVEEPDRRVHCDPPSPPLLTGDTKMMLITFILVLIAVSSVDCAVRFHVWLRTPRYVELGGAALLFCEHGVSREHLHKVEWLRDGRKLFQFVKERSPPFRNYSTPGADLDWTHTNERQVMLRNLRFEASGSYSCEVSTETPIYTKPSNDEPITVYLKQRADPQISGRTVYTAGERLELNCTSSPSHPEADITWFIDGEKVDDSFLVAYPGPRLHHGIHELAAATVQMSVELLESSKPELHVSCLATIPAFRGVLEHNQHQPSAFRYADQRAAIATVEVLSPAPPSPDTPAANISDGAASGPFHFPPFILAILVMVSNAR